MPFSELNLPESLVKAVKELGYTAPTAIQAKSIPLILAGKDIIGHSETGSGKTAAFGLPLLATLQPGQGVRALILTPTRELCVQVCDALKGFGKHMRFRITSVYGGVGIGAQISAARTADVIVATPGRLLDLMERGLRLSGVKYLVLDEADRMLDMGFIDDVEKIISHTPKQRQTILFSATLSDRLRKIVNRHMKEPVAVQAKTQVDASLLTEVAYSVPSQDKLSLLVHCLKHETPGIAIVFCGTRHGCDKVAKRLRMQQLDATPIHGGLSQSKRLHVIETLHRRGLGILVATDVASRGIHISNISHVYNYDLPNDSNDYTHRIGRTARAGAKGDAVTFVAREDERDFKHIMHNLNRKINIAPLPAFEKIAIPKGAEHERSDDRRHFAPRGEGGGHGGGRGRPGGGGQKRFWKKRR